MRHLCAAVLCVTLVCMAASRLPAQTSAAGAAARADQPIALWGSLSLGPGNASNRAGARLGAQAAVFGSYGPWAFGVRRGAASGFDSGGTYDDALLVGYRRLAPHATLIVLTGPARIYDESTGDGRVALGFAAEAGANLRFVGVGVSTFGAWRPGLSYIGVGLTLDAGFIR